MTIDIRMKRPGEQYSIYKNHSEATRGGKNPDAAPASKDKPTTPPDAQSSPSQPQPK
jgi:hypothetical protein